MPTTSRDSIQALYAAMLGYEADEESVAWWEGKELSDVIDAIADTDRYRERCAAVATGQHSPNDGRMQGAWRLHVGRGITEIAPSPVGFGAYDPLRVFPWSLFGEIVGPAGTAEAPTVRVLGRYATELTAELAQRLPGVCALAGIDNWAGAGVLVFTGHGDIDAVLWGMPQLVQQTTQRLMVPFHVARRRPALEIGGIRQHLRDLLHGLGFLHLRQVVGRRFGGDCIVVDESVAGAVTGVVHTDSAASPPEQLPTTAWFVADRTPVQAGW